MKDALAKTALVGLACLVAGTAYAAPRLVIGEQTTSTT